VEKTGPCPPLGRHAADPKDNWNQAWQAKPKPSDSFQVNTIQNALTPAQSINCIEPSPGLKLQLWASEEMEGHMAYLQHFTFDERGRVWAVEPKNYPNTILPAAGNITDQKFTGGKDRIVILEDTDGDKVMDKFKVFRDGLNLPQSIEVVNGGVVVTMTPYVVFFPNQNDTAGTPVILFSGMGSSGTSWDTHAGINQLMYGLDNWIYGQTGYNGGCSATANGAKVDCGNGKVWRFRHTSLGFAKTEFEVWATGLANADGLGQMEDGQIFLAGATGTSHMNHAPVQGSKAMDIRTANPAFNASANPYNVYYPITGDRFLAEGSTDKNADGWFTSGSTAVSGVQFYTSRLFPRKYWNRYVFTCEGSSKLCNQDSVVLSSKGGNIGSSWKAIRLPGPAHANLLASKDAWVAPLLAKTGPDGAVWVLDWNNYLFLHNGPVGPLLSGNAWENALRVKATNRIYRVVPEGATPEPVLNLANASEDGLIAAFANPNFFWRLTAQRLLLGKPYTAALGDKLKAILQSDRSMDSVGNCPRAQHALWTLDGFGQIAKDTATWNPVLAGLLKHPAWCVRRNVLRVMPRSPATAQAIDAACAVNDVHGHVRLQALLALGAIGQKPAGMKAIWTQFRDVDTTATGAFQKSGITAADPKPCSPAYDDPTPSALGRTGAAPLPGLRFQVQAGGFRLLPHGDLPSGDLSVYDIRGRLAFFAGYDAKRSAWSVAEAVGLRQPVYGYAFRGADGSVRRGNIALLGAR
jgi:putative membrane-bound dehydrogenase-like protein